MEEFTHIAPYYESLFPARKTQVDFLEKTLPRGAPARWVDIACGTGQQLEALHDRGREVWGLDLDAAMLSGLHTRRPDLIERTVRGDMREADRLLKEVLDGPAGVVYCIGNSLVQLIEDAEIVRAMRAFAGLLEGKGALCVQIVNFDRVLDGGMKTLKPLERTLGDGSSFILERRFDPSAEEGRLTFRTRLTTSDGIEEREQELRALRMETFSDLLSEAGFVEAAWFGDYDGGKWSPDSPATIVRAHRA
jgi:SAM-dependent methyltransferase